MKRSLVTTSILMLLLAPSVQAETARPLALCGVMQDLGRHMETITRGISHEDWALVEKTAPLIAEHPEPPFAEKTRILAFIGTDIGRFKSHDHSTHEAAQALRRAAGKQDGEAVVAAFRTLQSGCLGCHREFRQPFVEHFYGRAERGHADAR
jgi:cytochrome c556